MVSLTATISRLDGIFGMDKGIGIRYAFAFTLPPALSSASQGVPAAIPSNGESVEWARFEKHFFERTHKRSCETVI
jgi:hypothetical protein